MTLPLAIWLRFFDEPTSVSMVLSFVLLHGGTRTLVNTVLAYSSRFVTRGMVVHVLSVWFGLILQV